MIRDVDYLVAALAALAIAKLAYDWYVNWSEERRRCRICNRICRSRRSLEQVGKLLYCDRCFEMYLAAEHELIPYEKRVRFTRTRRPGGGHPY